MQLHPDNEKWGKEKQLLELKGLIGLGDWEERISQQEDFQYKMEKGDVVAIKCGARPIALVEVIGDYEYTKETGDLDWFERRRKVRILDWYQRSYNFEFAPRATLVRCDTSGDAATTRLILQWHQKYLSGSMMIKIINLLEHKRQIILQGPPGTGKTWLAKRIAQELAKPKKVGSAIQKIDQYFRDFNGRLPEVQEKRQEVNALVKEFQETFPKEQLKELSLERYAIGTGSNDSFCWWIERGLRSLGSYSPGTSKSYLIYWKKDPGEYSLNGKAFEEMKDHEEAMKKVAQTLSELVERQDYEKSRELLPPGFVLKILHSYYPDKYFPINSERCLNNALKLFGLDSAQMSPLEKNLRLQALFLEKRERFQADITNQEFTRFLFNNFDLQGKISLQAAEVISTGEFRIVQFHPAYSYEDFVRGITAEVNEQNQIEYKVTNKILAEFAERALNNPSAKFILVIDEINRANLPAVLGELIYALEYRYDEKEDDQLQVRSMYATREEKELEGDSTLKLPQNLFIIGTMNTADRSVGHIDYAIRRRFAFVEMLPQQSVVEEQACEQAVELFKQTAELFCRDLGQSRGEPLERSDYLSPEFRPEDVMIGHSYFLEKDLDKLRLRLQYEIKPILKEYLKDGVLLNGAAAKIEALHV